MSTYSATPPPSAPLSGPDVAHAEKNAGNWSTELFCVPVNCSGKASLI